MNNKQKQPAANSNEAATDLLAALTGKTPEEQAQLLAASLQAYQDFNDQRIDTLTQSQEDMARTLEGMGGEAVKAKVDEAATIAPKKSFASGAVDVITSKPVIIGAAVLGGTAIAATGVYMYKKHQGNKASTETAGEEAMLVDGSAMSSSDVSKDAAVAAALSER